jgi:hypothetical protein
MQDLQNQVDALVKQHQQKAEQSAYDRNVAIVAIGYASQLLESFPYSGKDSEDLPALVASLEQLRTSYNDKSGEYTSGKGEIGSLTRAIAGLADKDALSEMPTKNSDMSLTPQPLVLPGVINEAEVPRTQPHFVIRYGDFMADDILFDVAAIGLENSQQDFILEWLDNPQRNEKVISEVTKALSYYLSERPQEKADENETLNTTAAIWKYMMYHATGTSANLYGDIHWLYVDPNAPKKASVSEVLSSAEEYAQNMTWWQTVRRWINQIFFTSK